MDCLVHHTTVNGSFELFSRASVILHYAVEKVSPVTHFMQKRHASEADVATKRSEPQIGIRVLLELVDEVIYRSVLTAGGWFLRPPGPAVVRD